MKYYYLILFFSMISSFSFAQTGTLSGIVTDAKTGEPLIGAIVAIEEKGIGASTDLDGYFILLNVPEGTHTVKANYLGFEPRVIEGVAVKAGEEKELNISMAEEEEVMNEIVVEYQVDESSEQIVLKQQQESSIIQDGLAADVMSKTGATDVSAAAQTVTGLSVEGGKYAVVRGLGDRYSKIYLNGADIPSLDPNRNSVQIDLFPSNLIDNLVVFKTFSPDLPGNFSGGIVNIVTKDFPEKFTFQGSAKLGYNTNATFNNSFLTYEGSSTDWLGFDNGLRDRPEAVLSGIPTRNDYFLASDQNAVASEINTATKSFNKVWRPSTDAPFLNQNYSFSIGDKTTLFGNTFGFIGGVTYQKNNNYYEDGKMGLYRKLSSSTDELAPDFLLEDRMGWKEVLWAGLLNISYKLSEKHQLSLNVMRNQSGVSMARSLHGKWNEYTIDDRYIYRTSVLSYVQRAISTAQIIGEHEITDKIKVDWLSSAIYSTQETPDMRFFTDDYVVNGNDTTYNINKAAYFEPSRFFRYMDEINFDNKLNISYNFKQWNGLEAKIKVGGAYVYKERKFSEYRYEFQSGGNEEPYTGDLDRFLADENLGVIGGNFAVYVEDVSQASNQYFGKEKIGAAYAMTDLPLSARLSVLTGLRVERTDIYVASEKENTAPGVLENIDFLPSVNLKYMLTEEMNIRGGYSRTLARPVFRELAPFASFDFVGGNNEIGNPFLVRTVIDNFDLRWEMFPAGRGNEIFAVSGFYKIFEAPIERVFNAVAQNREMTWKNVDRAIVYGLEFEARKGLDFIAGKLKNFRLGTNVTLLKSQVAYDPQELQQIRDIRPGAEDTRPLFGQSPYLVNAYAFYQSDSLGLNINLSYNIFGPRIFAVGFKGTPHIFEQPRGSLNLTIGYRFLEKWQVSASAKNLLNPQFLYIHEFTEDIYRSYRLGRTFSLGISFLVE